MVRFLAVSLACVVVLGLAPLGPTVLAQQAPLPVPDWPDLYDPFTLLTYNLELAPGDWNTIRHDQTYDIEVPAKFWAEDESPILVSVRRKSADALPSEADPQKVSLKIDINEYEDGGICVDADGNPDDHGFPGVPCVSTWHGVKKLSLENGDDNNVVSEGVSWYLHRVASEGGLDYTPGYATWIKLYTNGEWIGVYANVEQRDKQFMKNHDLWSGGDETWLYKYSDPYDPEIKVGPEDETIDSPLYNELCYSPFQDPKGACEQPADFVSRLQATINMESMLALGAVAAFHISPDDLFSKGKNFYFVDYTPAGAAQPLSPENRKREYVEWDLDAAFSSYATDDSIYTVCKAKSCPYQDEILANATFRAQYDQIMCDLLAGPFQEASLHAALTAMEAETAAALDADPNNQLPDTAAGEFGNLRSFVSDRIVNVQAQLGPCSPTAVTLNYFRAAAVGDAVQLEWETAAALDNAGFNLYRAVWPGGKWLRLNAELIPDQGAPGSPLGAAYTWLDTGVQPSVVYDYWLEDLDRSGRTTLHGPAGAVVGPAPVLELPDFGSLFE